MSPFPTRSERSFGHSLLDRAILVSLAAMAAMNLLVLAQQLQPEPSFTMARGTNPAAMA